MTEDVKSQERIVVAYRDANLKYPASAPFDPDSKFPEYPFGPVETVEANPVYAAVRQVLYLAGLDEQHFGSAAWNPFGVLVKPGSTVLIKPNWVRHYHLRGEDLFSIITHPAVIRPLIDYAYKAVGASGRVWLMDAPLYDTDFSAIRRLCQLDRLEQVLRERGVPLVIADLRALVAESHNGVVTKRTDRQTWEAESVTFDLGGESEFVELGSSIKNVFGSDYDRRVTSHFHQQSSENHHIHCYQISRRVLDADLVISVPKLKTHKKTGVSLNIKNMIGINTDKNYIPHYRVGAPSQGGDEFPDSASKFKQFRRWVVRHSIDLVLARMGNVGEEITHSFMSGLLTTSSGRLERKKGKKLDPIDIFYQAVQGDEYRTGNWWGNDTCWRPGLDINKILFYGTSQGEMIEQPARKFFSLIDGIVGGEGEGPLAPVPRQEGVLLAGFDPISVDRIAIKVMGLNPDLIRDVKSGESLSRHALTQARFPILVRSNLPEWQPDILPEASLHFRPHESWEAYFSQSR
jgi:uncharacterized protein (DUF362 family)